MPWYEVPGNGEKFCVDTDLPFQKCSAEKQKGWAPYTANGTYCRTRTQMLAYAGITAVDNKGAEMVFNVITTVKMTKKNDDGTLTSIERVVVNKTGIVAADAATAALIAGGDVTSNFTPEDLSTATTVTTQVK